MNFISSQMATAAKRAPATPTVSPYSTRFIPKGIKQLRMDDAVVAPCVVPSIVVVVVVVIGEVVVV